MRETRAELRKLLEEKRRELWGGRAGMLRAARRGQPRTQPGDHLGKPRPPRAAVWRAPREARCSRPARYPGVRSSKLTGPWSGRGRGRGRGRSGWSLRDFRRLTRNPRHQLEGPQHPHGPQRPQVEVGAGRGQDPGGNKQGREKAAALPITLLPVSPCLSAALARGEALPRPRPLVSHGCTSTASTGRTLAFCLAPGLASDLPSG